MRHCKRAIPLLIPVLFPPLLGAQDVPLAWDFPEVWRAGGLHAPEWAQFSRREDMAFDGSGNLYVVDSQALHIAKVGPDGSLIRTIGREGEGPGEFGWIFGVTVWPDGSFVVRDGRRSGLQLFSADGEFERIVRWRPETGQVDLPSNMSRTTRAGPRPGILYAQGADFRVGRMVGAVAELLGSEPDEEEADERMIEVLDLTGDVVTGETALEAWRPPRPEAEEIDLGNPASLASTFAEAPIFEPLLVWDVLPGGAIAYADSSTYTIRIVQDGAVLRTLERPIAPQPVTPAIESLARDAMLSAVDDELGVDVSEAAARMARATMLEAFDNMTFYPEISVIAEIRTTPDGFVWVQRQDPVIEENDGPIDVFDPDGSYVGTFPRDGLRLPRAFGPDGLVAYWEIDDMDIPSIVVYRLPEKLWR